MGHVARMGKMKNAHSILVRKPEGKKAYRKVVAYLHTL